MQKTRDIRIEEFNYPLPDERIAKFPLSQRDRSKLLLYRSGSVSESEFFRLPDLLPENSLLVFSNTKVIQARLHFQERDRCIRSKYSALNLFLRMINLLSIPVQQGMCLDMYGRKFKKVEKRNIIPDGYYRG